MGAGQGSSEQLVQEGERHRLLLDDGAEQPGEEHVDAQLAGTAAVTFGAQQRLDVPSDPGAPAVWRSAAGGTGAHMEATSHVARSRLTSTSTLSPARAVTAWAMTGLVMLRRVADRPRIRAVLPRRAVSCQASASLTSGS